MAAVRPVSGSGAAIAPGSLISIYGANLAGAETTANATPLPRDLDGTSVLMNGSPIPLLFASPSQINAQTPFEIAAGTGTVVVIAGGISSAPAAVEVRPSAPVVFTVGATGHALALNAADWTLNSAAAPARAGDYLVIYLTGQGAVGGAVTGMPSPDTPASLGADRVQVKIGGRAAVVAFAGLLPGFIGLTQMNVQVPEADPGEQPLEVTIDGATAAGTVVSLGR